MALQLRLLLLLRSLHVGAGLLASGLRTTPVEDGALARAGCPRSTLKRMSGAVPTWDFEQCPGDAAQRWTLASAPGPFERPLLGNGSRLQQELENVRSSFNAKRDEALGAFQRLRHVTAWHALALKETWSDEDTEFMQRLDPQRGAFVPGKLSTAAFAEQLPSMENLSSLIAQKDIAIVGSGPSMQGQGADIDTHPIVVRFNDMIGNRLTPNATGMRTTMHVMNVHVDPPPEPGVLQLDLESTVPSASYCQRMHKFGKFHHADQASKVLFFRPSAICQLPHLAGWSRGFLFYWLIGSLFEEVSMYGMRKGDGRVHCSECPTHDLVAEPYLDFEHEIYDVIARLQKEEEEHTREKDKLEREDIYRQRSQLKGIPRTSSLNQTLKLQTPHATSVGRHLRILS